MKKYIKLALMGFACCTFATSCHGDLDIMQDNQLSASNMWTDAADVTQSTRGAYLRLRNNFASEYQSAFYWGEVRVGEYMWGRSLLNDVHNLDMSNTLENKMSASTESAKWSALYSAIDQANAVLKYAGKVNMSDSERGWAIGQAAFARAYAYFWAARVWGDVPLNLNPIESATQPETYPSRTPKAKVYEQIGKDIELALENADYLGSNQYFATKDAANMLKAEYALWMYSTQGGDASYLTLAEDALTAIKISGDRLLDDYAEIFSRTNKKNGEIIFALQNDQTAKLLSTCYYERFYLPAAMIQPAKQQNPVPINATQWWSYSKNFVDLLREQRDVKGDKRVACNLGDGEYLSEGNSTANDVDGIRVTWPNKFLGDMSTAITINDCDLVYYRYAQAVMMHAELKYYQKQYDEALKSLNIIAKRAYGVDNYYTTANKEGVLKALCDEYFYEFPAEGVIWWALIRLDKIWDYNSYLKSMKDHPNILLWPISASARNKNSKLEQTEGWS